MIYLLGGTGYVGRAYQALLTRRQIPYRSLGRAEIDATRPQDLRLALLRDRPEFLINAAGYTGRPNVDACEMHRTECLLGNAVLPGIVAEACAAAGVPWGHVSSGCIFSGTNAAGEAFTEEDTPNFTFRTNHCSFYSGTKALGEEVLAGCPAVYIWRLRIPFNEVDHPRNYLTKLMQYPRLLDATNSISQLDEFCAATLACWEQRVPFGIYHVTNPGRITTREIVALLRHAGLGPREYRFFTDEEEFMRLAARTPRSNCLLDSRKLAATGIRLTEVHDAIARDLCRWQRAAA
jgi:dTDP-4-dehydrorhamnose reductase